MTIGVGGLTPQQALAELDDMTADVQPIGLAEYQQRLNKAQAIMQANDMAAVYLNAGTNLYYFTGTRWFAGERLVGAILPAEGELVYLAPYFEVSTLEGFFQIPGEVKGWHEDQDPYLLVAATLRQMGITTGNIGMDEAAPFFLTDGITQAAPEYRLVSAKTVTAGCRMCKSKAEIALLQQAKNMTLAVQKAAAKILHLGISTQTVKKFIDDAHRKVGARAGSSFCIVLFGVDSSFPHGVINPQPLQQDDMVLIDTGCLVEGYQSDITRSYVFGQANARQRQMWAIEKQAQAIAFEQAQLGVPCAEVDSAAREYLATEGLGPDYQVPGLPHRTGHGIGLDIHEWPYLVKNDRTPLAPGMCFSNEPMLVIPGEFGVRLEDHFYMTESGPRWFTEPSSSIDDPFGLSIKA